jgi:DNA-binding transcriptional LysR family regulator
MQKPSFTLEQARSFLAVAEYQHVSKAAASLFLTQSAVTQQLRHLERALGVRLVERSGRGVRLTDAGRAVAASCRTALRAVELVEDSARAARTVQAGSLHLGASPTCAAHYLPTSLATFSQRFSGVELKVTIEPSRTVNEQVLAGTIDAAFVESAVLPGLISAVLAKDELVVVAHRDHPLAKLRKVTSADLATHRYLARSPGWAAEQAARDLMGDAYLVGPVLELGHPEYIRAAVVAGLGYAVMPIVVIAAELDSGVLVRLPRPSGYRDIRAIRRPSQGGPAMEAFWSHVTAARLS